MGPIWGWQDPGGPNFGPMNFAVWVVIHKMQVFIYALTSTALIMILILLIYEGESDPSICFLENHKHVSIFSVIFCD